MKISKILLLSCAFFCSSAYSNDQGSADEFCKSISEMARVIMEKRQQGFDIIKIIEIVEDDELAKQIVLDAYEERMNYTESMKLDSINRFANLWAVACIREQSKNKKPL